MATMSRQYFRAPSSAECFESYANSYRKAEKTPFCAVHAKIAYLKVLLFMYVLHQVCHCKPVFSENSLTISENFNTPGAERTETTKH